MQYRGSKGSVKVATNSVAQVRSWEGDFERPWIEGTVMGDGADKGGVDIPGGQGRITVDLDYGDTAQAALIDAILGNDDVSPMATNLIVDGTGPKQFDLNILPTSVGMGGQVKGGYFQATFQWRSHGSITPNWT